MPMNPCYSWRKITSDTAAFIWRNLSEMPAISKCRFLVMAKVRSSHWVNAIVRSSGAIRKSSKKHQHPTCQKRCAGHCSNWRYVWARPSGTDRPEPLNTFSTQPAANSIFLKSIHACRLSMVLPKQSPALIWSNGWFGKLPEICRRYIC